MANTNGNPGRRGAAWSRRVVMAGVALSVAIGAPLRSATAEVAAAQVDHTVIDHSHRWNLTFWGLDFCILNCVPGLGLCCGEEEDIPLL